MSFGLWIKKVRNDNNLTQKELAQIMCITRDLIAKYETDKIEPSYDFLKKFCVFFNLSADEVLEIDTREQKEKILKLKGKID